MYTATLKFTSREDAKAFAQSWAFWSKRGYSLSATSANGETSLTLDGVTPQDRQWINNRIAMLNAKKEREAA
jgi:hypothetical protein